MAKLPKLPRSSSPTPWIDLIAFLAILALGGVLMALGRATAGSLATVCAALAGLYAAYKWPRPPAGPSGTDGTNSKPDQHHPE